MARNPKRGSDRPQRRAIGIVRVSQTAGRHGESFASPAEQRDRIREACERDGLELQEVVEELDVSGATALADRDGLRHAIEQVEAGAADVIVAAYFDRLVRSLRVQDELVSRIEAAGGRVLAVDVGQVSNGSAGQWLSGTMLGAVAEYHRRTSAERSAEAQQRAITRGVAPWPRIPPGYTREDDGRLAPDPETAAVVTEAFQLRADGATIEAVRGHLRDRGVNRSYHGVQALLGSRVVRGEIHFGNYEPNLRAHPAIVEEDVWQAVQRTVVQRGRRAKSTRLLARLGVLRCRSCGSRMVVGTVRSKYYMYRCPPVGDCRRRTTISAQIVEDLVVSEVRAAIRDLEGTASAGESASAALRQFEEAQANLDAAFRAFAGFEGEEAARERLEQLRKIRDEAQERLDRVSVSSRSIAISGAADWDRLTLEEQRALITATISSVTVDPGRGVDRVTVELLGQ